MSALDAWTIICIIFAKLTAYDYLDVWWLVYSMY